MNFENLKPIKHLGVKKDMKVSELVEGFGDIGFTAKKIYKASEILQRMKNDKDCKIFLGIAGAMVPGGMKKIILQMLDYCSVFVTTGANLTHDLIEALGEEHYQGSEKVDDKKLNEQGIDRIYDVFMKNIVYRRLEDFFEKNWEKLQAKNIKELLWKIGECIENEESILRKCYEKKIPVFCPALADSGIGLMIWGRKMQGKQMNIDMFDDMNEIIELAWTAKKRGIVYVGGGVPKNFIQQSLQFSKGADYGIQITTEREEFGGSSGAPLQEGISWGKMQKGGNFVDVRCDATVALPLILAAVG